MIVLQNVSYAHPNKEVLFTNINFTVNKFDKIALIGNNGSGKSTLLKLISGNLKYTVGQLSVDVLPYFIPQVFGQYDHLTVSQALGIEQKLNALKLILGGDTTETNFDLLQDDWAIEERCTAAFAHWRLANTGLDQKLSSLSGGEKTKIFLAGIDIHQPELILMDEPSNHLDNASRELLYHFIQSTKSTLVIVSHDRKLLNLLLKAFELSPAGIKVYGGNYQFYTEQKQVENDALNQDILSKEKALRKAKEKERETIERQQKLDARGKGKQEKAGVAKIMMNTLRNNAENSTAKIKSAHAEKIDGISKNLQELRSTLPGIDKMKFGFYNSVLHKGKILFNATNINFAYNEHPVWKRNLSFQINSGERLALKGNNGAGKTTLIKIIMGDLEPSVGTVFRADTKAVYIDQAYSLVNDKLSVYEQAQTFNNMALQEHEVKIRLNRFLFTRDDWNKPCIALSGGERMRLLLCCLTMNTQSPDMIILDEPTNNLDIQNIEILTAAINEYQGTLIVVSHDDVFQDQINIDKSILLS